MHAVSWPRTSSVSCNSSSSSRISGSISSCTNRLTAAQGREQDGRAEQGSERSLVGGRQGRVESPAGSITGGGAAGQGGRGRGRYGGGRGGGRGGDVTGGGRGGGGGQRRGGLRSGGAGDSPFSNTRLKSFAELEHLVQQYGTSIKARDLSAMFSRLKIVPAASLKQKVALLQQMLQLLEPQLQQWQPRGLGEVMLTCSKLGYGGAELYSSCLGVFISKLQQADVQGLANVVYAVATAPDDSTKQKCWPVVEQQLLPAFTEAAADGQAAPQETSNVLWGVATMEQQLSPEQLQHLLTGFVRVVDEAEPQAIANVTLAIAKMQQQVPAGQLQKLMEALASKLPSAKPQHVANTMWGVARLQPQPFYPAPLLEPKAKQAIIRMLPAMIPQHFANIAWAYGMLGYQDEQLLLPLFNRARTSFFIQEGSTSRKGEATTQHLGNMCWAAAVLNMQQLIGHVKHFATAVSGKWEDTAPEGKQQLYQVHMWLLDQQGNSRGLSGCLSAQQLQECKEQWQERVDKTAASGRTSTAHKAIFEAARHLQGLGQPSQFAVRETAQLNTFPVICDSDLAPAPAATRTAPPSFLGPCFHCLQAYAAVSTAATAAWHLHGVHWLSACSALNPSSSSSSGGGGRRSSGLAASHGWVRGAAGGGGRVQGSKRGGGSNDSPFSDIKDELCRASAAGPAVRQQHKGECSKGHVLPAKISISSISGAEVRSSTAVVAAPGASAAAVSAKDHGRGHVDMLQAGVWGSRGV